jgi:hypothetical protein
MNVLFFITFLSLSGLGLSQDELRNTDRSNYIYLRAGFYELSLGYERKMNSRFGLGIEVDYRHRFVDESLVRAKNTFVNLSYQGVRIKTAINFYDRLGEDIISILPSYRYLESGDLTRDANHFSGCNTCGGEYSKYTEKIDEFGLTILWSKRFDTLPYLYWYIGGGLLMRFTDRHYTVTGIYSNQTSVDLNYNNIVTFWPNFAVGVKVHFPHFGKYTK